MKECEKMFIVKTGQNLGPYVLYGHTVTEAQEAGRYKLGRTPIVEQWNEVTSEFFTPIQRLDYYTAISYADRQKTRCALVIQPTEEINAYVVYNTTAPVWKEFVTVPQSSLEDRIQQFVNLISEDVKERPTMLELADTLEESLQCLRNRELIVDIVNGSPYYNVELIMLKC